MLAASSHDRNNDPESNHITVSTDVHTAFLHADVDQDLFAEPPEPDEWDDALQSQLMLPVRTVLYT